jgi:AraC-like DNA-binding protein
MHEDFSRDCSVFAQALGLAVLTSAVITNRSPHEVCAQLALDPSPLLDPVARLPHAEVEHAWRALSHDHDDFGLHAARVVEGAPRSLVEYAISNAGDVGGALRVFVRFQRLIHDGAAHTIESRDGRDILRLALRAPLTMPDALWDYLCATAVTRTRRALTEPVDPVEVHLTRHAFRDDSLAAQTFRAPIRYGAPRAEVHWPRGVLARPLERVDATLHQLLVRQLEAALGVSRETDARALLEVSDDLIVRLKRELRVLVLRDQARLDRAARALATSVRSLQRRLAERGTTFHAVVDDTRRAVAIELLSAPGATVTEAALGAGFADASAFNRAFRRWTNCTPSEYLRARST